MPPTTTSGVHHVTFPVSDLQAGSGWYERVLGATRIPRLDHHDPSGALFAVIMRLPGLAVPVQLRIAPEVADAMAGFTPVTLSVPDLSALERWAGHLDALDVTRTEIRRARIGHCLDLHTPDGMNIQLYTEAAGPLETVTFTED